MLEHGVLDASAQFPAVLVTGPHQVGKTTLLRRMSRSGRRYASLDDLALRELAAGDPGLFLQRFPPPVLIDEIQYAPDLLPHIKLRIDEDRRPGSLIGEGAVICLTPESVPLTETVTAVPVGAI